MLLFLLLTCSYVLAERPSSGRKDLSWSHYYLENSSVGLNVWRKSQILLLKLVKLFLFCFVFLFTGLHKVLVDRWTLVGLVSTRLCHSTIKTKVKINTTSESFLKHWVNLNSHNGDDAVMAGDPDLVLQSCVLLSKSLSEVTTGVDNIFFTSGRARTIETGYIIKTKTPQLN